MHIRQKGAGVRIAVSNTSVIENVDYILIEPGRCWVTTFKSWGKKVELPAIVEAGGKRFRVYIEEIQ